MIMSDPVCDTANQIGIDPVSDVELRLNSVRSPQQGQVVVKWEIENVPVAEGGTTAAATVKVSVAGMSKEVTRTVGVNEVSTVSNNFTGISNGTYEACVELRESTLSDT